jgi:hypothetical protein
VPDAATEIDRLDGLRAAWAPRIRAYDAYYEGEQPIRFMAPAMRREFGDRITALVINLPRFGADAYEHDLGRLPMVPLVNRPRMMRPDGVSEFHDVLPIADAANKQATDMMISGEYHAMPRRYAFGLKEEDFVDAAGNQISPWSMMAGHLWANEDPNIKVGQFPEADLTNFHNTLKVLVQVATMTLALPPHFNPFTGENPASADAIRSSETQLVKRVERKHTFLGGGWEEVERLVLRFQTGTFEARARSLETMWRDPSTPTVAQKADAVMKLATPINGGRAILPIEQAREDLGYTPEQRRRMAEMDDRAAVDQNVATIARTFAAGGTASGAPAAGVG